MDKQSSEEQSTLGKTLHIICWHITTAMSKDEAKAKDVSCAKHSLPITQVTKAKNLAHGLCVPFERPAQTVWLSLCPELPDWEMLRKQAVCSKSALNTSGLGTCYWPLTTPLLPSPGSLLLLLDDTFFAALLSPLLCALVASWDCSTPTPLVPTIFCLPLF